MHYKTMLEAKLLLLIIITNGAPVMLSKLLPQQLRFPVDFKVLFIDNKPLLGPSKTLPGIASAIIASMLVAPLLGFSLITGAALGASAMAGDLLTSFIKRRLNMPTSSMALGLDQIPESLLPILLAKQWFDLGWYSVISVVVLFFILELVISRILYEFHLRDTWY